jgi:hypothetical protein
LPPGLFLAFFAVPFGRDQPTEIWFLAKLRFWFLPRQRIWNQSGVKELVTITVPKKVERVLTNGLSETEVKSRLQALANTIDSRGWAIKNVNTYAQPVVIGASADRLIDLSSLPQEVPDYDADDTSDIMDPINSHVAQQVDTMVNLSSQIHHQQLVDELNAPIAAPTQSSPSWFMGQSNAATVAPPVLSSQQSSPFVAPQQPVYSIPLPPAQPNPVNMAIPITADEAALSQQLRHQANSQQSAYSHLRTMQPLGSEPASAIAAPKPFTSNQTRSNIQLMPKDPRILSLASNDDLDVATLARQAQRAKDNEDQEPDEVVISLR